jgi:murein DD-endopeptidase MepM/ murein hydrolase activator NlpD
MKYNGVFIGWPLASNVIRAHSVRNTFGMVRKNVDGTPRAHQGWDFYATVGTELRSVSEGEVVHVSDRGALGLMLVVTIGNSGMFAAYCHLSEVDVSVGDSVNLGQKIGLTGSTGNAAGLPISDSHLHFEVRAEPLTGLGLDGRVSPIKIFGVCPLLEAIENE